MHCLLSQYTILPVGSCRANFPGFVPVTDFFLTSRALNLSSTLLDRLFFVFSHCQYHTYLETRPLWLCVHHACIAFLSINHAGGLAASYTCSPLSSGLSAPCGYGVIEVARRLTARVVKGDVSSSGPPTSARTARVFKSVHTPRWGTEDAENYAPPPPTPVEGSLFVSLQ